MGATRPASGIFQQPRPAVKCNAHALNKGSPTALITCLSVSLFLNSDAGRVAPIRGSVLCLRLVLAFSACVRSNVNVLPVSFLCQNGKQVEIITKEHLNFVI